MGLRYFRCAFAAIAVITVLSASADALETYDGRLRVYLVEPTSRWNDDWGHPYHFGFLDWSVDSTISLSETDTIDIEIDWYAPDHGFSGITESNIMAIAAVFNSEGHPAYSYPAEQQNPFTAHYVDAAAGATPGNPGANLVSSSFTHTVLIEEATSTWCQYCPYVSMILNSMYESGDYPFYFISVPEDVGPIPDGDSVSLSWRWINDYYNRLFLPTCYSDGGYRVHMGYTADSTEAYLKEQIEECGAREVTELELHLTVDWIGDNTVRTRVSVWHRPEIPPFTINLLPNPAIPFELDVIAFPAGQLSSEPRAIIESPGGIDTLAMTELTDRDAETYLLDYQIRHSGAYTISVCDSDTLGLGCSELAFSGAPIFAGEGALLRSCNGLFGITVPPHSFQRDALLLCREKSPTIDALEGVCVPAHIDALLVIEARSTFRELNSTASLTVDLSKLDLPTAEFGSIVLAHLSDGAFRTVESEIDSYNGELVAEIRELGTYVVGKSSATAIGADESADSPVQLLHQNHPNPFNTGTTISFSLPDAARVRLDLYNILGQNVVTLLNHDMSAGSHEVFWDGRNKDGDDCSSGIYFYRIETDSFSEIKRMLLLK